MKAISKLKDDARRHEQREEWEKAIQVYLQVLEISEAGEVELPLYNRIGDLCLRLGHPHDAVRYYEEAADRYAEAGLYNNAIALCNKALRYQPQHLELLRKLGQFSAAQGFLTDARRYYLEYVEKEFANQNADAAIGALEDYVNASADDDAREMLGRRLLEHGRTARGITALRQAHDARMAAGETDRAAALRREIEAHNPAAFSEPAPRSEQVLDWQPEVVSHETSETLDFEVTATPHDELNAVQHAEEQLAADIVPFDPLEGLETEFQAEPAEPTVLEGLESTSLDFGTASEGIEVEDIGIIHEETSFDLPLLDEPLSTEDDDAGTTGTESFALPGLETEPVARTDDESVSGSDTEPLPGLDTVDLPGFEQAAEDSALQELMASDLPLLEDPLGEDPLLGDSFDFDLPPLPGEATDDDDFAIDLPPLPEPGAEQQDTPAAEAEPAPPAEPPLERAVSPEDEQYLAALLAEEDDELTADVAAGDDAAQSALTGDDVARLDVDLLHAPEEATPAADYEIEDVAALDEVGSAAAEELADEAAHAPAPADAGPEPAPEEATPAPADAEEGYVDLAALLTPGKEDTTRFQVQETDPTGDEDRDFAELLSQFKAKVSDHVPTEDAAAHYDLGLAFKEMGLIDEAIAEFQIALRADHMRLKVLEELGHCFLQKEQYNIAEKVLRRALSTKYDDELELLGVYYHLGRAYEGMGRREEARDAYERVLGMDINFSDASARLARL